MGCAAMAHVLWGQEMIYNPTNPDFANRDRFVLSNGHCCALQYAMLHMTGYNLSIDDLMQFRQVGSKTPGHPENHLTDGVEVSTGPLGQGLSNAVGFAIAQQHLAAQFNKPNFPLIDHKIFVICGDGCLQEGVTAESCSLAGHLKLGNLILLYDDNHIQIDGTTDLAFGEDVLKRFEAYGWHTQSVPDGDKDIDGISAAIAEARQVTDRPSIIKVTTTIGFGSSKQGTEKTHGAPLGAEDIVQVKTKFGFDPTNSFHVDQDVYDTYACRAAAGAAAEAKWNEMLAEYGKVHPELAAEFTRRIIKRELPANWQEGLLSYPEGSKNIATRAYSGQVLNSLAKVIPELLSGSADLTPSNKTWLTCSHNFTPETPDGRYIRYGVREHGMSAVCNGMASYGGVIPACATFLTFVGYAMGAVRMSALSHFRVVYIMTHDSIGVGEDGPTHQPIETLMQLRTIPNLLTLRPCDGNETSGAYEVALQHTHTPSVLALSRQTAPRIPGSSREGVHKGAYVVDACEGVPQVVLVGSGTEVLLCCEAKKQLLSANASLRVNVVSMPCWELFDAQPQEYQLSVFPHEALAISCEAGTTVGWDRYTHGALGVSTFGMSGKGAEVYKHFNLTSDALTKYVTNSLEQLGEQKLRSRVHRFVPSL
jgi:transketolase